jgi:hypothetical protein
MENYELCLCEAIEDQVTADMGKKSFDDMEAAICYTLDATADTKVSRPSRYGLWFLLLYKTTKAHFSHSSGQLRGIISKPRQQQLFNRLRRQNNVQLPPMTVARPAIMSNNVWLHLVK